MKTEVDVKLALLTILLCRTAMLRCTADLRGECRVNVFDAVSGKAPNVPLRKKECLVQKIDTTVIRLLAIVSHGVMEATQAQLICEPLSKLQSSCTQSIVGESH